jgi:glucose-specific phosphotransferase system IIA component
MLVSFAVAFVVSFVLYKDEVVAENPANAEKNSAASNGAAANTNAAANADTKASVYNPIKGKVVELKEVPDSTFAEGILGKGFAVVPEDGKVVAPVSGVITTLFPTKHAVGISGDNGVELLVHIGINTVELNGEGFKAHVAQGDRVKAGDLLMECDFSLIKERGFETITPVVVTNTDAYSEVTLKETGNKEASAEILTLTK